MHADQELDTKELLCPIPVMKATAQLTKMTCGEVLHVIATDPHTVPDFQLLTSLEHFEMLHHYTENKEFHFYIEKLCETATEAIKA